MRSRGVLLLAGLFLASGAAAAAETHWPFRPRSHPEVPPAAARVRNPIDAFVLAGLEKAGLQPAPEADRRTLIRRVTFDLTGLPPAPEEIAAFAADPGPDAYERLVERLLASPQYGERWGQHWLTVVRYGETEGFEYDRHRPGAWRFRDCVIRCFNEDRPFDRFLREQLAGDEIDPANPEMQVAAGFHRLGLVRRNAGNQEVAASRNEVLTERTDAIGLRTVENPYHFRDLHTTLLHLLGLDQDRLSYLHLGCKERLTLVQGKVIEQLL
jgi:hypothetical protein